MMVTTLLTRSEPSVTGNENRTNPIEESRGDVKPTIQSGGYLSINFFERHCIFCNRLTPYTLNWEDGWLKKMWLCWQHLSNKMKRELQDFYEEIGETYTPKREERDEP